jgi:hypothetical protein
MDDTLYHYCRSHYRIINIKKDIDFKIYVFFYYIKIALCREKEFSILIKIIDIHVINS